MIFAVSVLGLTLVPGRLIPTAAAQGRLSFFHAVYFISYTATTIGFGEIPYAFSEQQRLWTLLCIYLSVIGWAYTLGTVFAMLQDKNFSTPSRYSALPARCATCASPSSWCAATAGWAA